MSALFNIASNPAQQAPVLVSVVPQRYSVFYQINETFKAAFKVVSDRYKAHKLANELAELSNTELSDLGIARGNIEAIARLSVKNPGQDPREIV
ncbi:DUF1127 domain-containing protein [Kiloniella sp. b19]|uniref:DUF1127 domain-containing protein n=1 Tax=Kiloniella sp. GXU_MW_B19 TaxID=3141326 RepID=UPI0031DB5524